MYSSNDPEVFAIESNHLVEQLQWVDDGNVTIESFGHKVDLNE